MTTLLISHQLDPLQEKQMESLDQNSSSLKQRTISPEEIVLHKDKYCSDGDIKSWVLAFQNNEMIGKIAIFSREITFKNQIIILGGIGKVKVRDDQRKKGIATKMMNAAMEELHKINCDVAFLCTDISNQFLVSFYNKFGFTLLNKNYTYLSKSGARYIEPDGMLAPVKSLELFGAILMDEDALDIGVGNW